MRLNYEEIREKIVYNADIVAVISEYITLKRAGANFKANCPFHNEKTASFIVSPVKQIFHCFGCGTGGSVIEFVQRIGGYSYPETIEYLCEKFGIEFTRNDSISKDTRDILLEINSRALEFFKRELKKNGDAYNYIRNRGVTDETLALFGVGYAPDSWISLKNYLNSFHYSENALIESGLLIKREDKESYNRFRNRIMFPIFDIANKTIAFGGRSLDPEEPAKYLNSPETPIYHKGNGLYGLNLSKQYIKPADRVYIFEGYMDLIICYQAGIKNVVATLGTALTPAQIRLLTRYTKKLTLVFDGDAAGINAMARSVEKMLELDVYPDIFVIEDEYDPAEIILEKGVDYFLRKLNKPMPFFDFILGKLLREHNVDDIREKQTVIGEVLKLLKYINDNIAFSEYIKQLSETLKIDYDTLLQESRKRIKMLKSRVVSGDIKEESSNGFALTEKSNSELFSLEGQVIKFMMENDSPLVINEFKQVIITPPSGIFGVVFVFIFNSMTADFHKLYEHFNDNQILKTALTALSLQPISYLPEDAEKIKKDYLSLLKARAAELEILPVSQSVKNTGRGKSETEETENVKNDEIKKFALLQRQFELKRKKIDTQQYAINEKKY